MSRLEVKWRDCRLVGSQRVLFAMSKMNIVRVEAAGIRMRGRRRRAFILLRIPG